MDASDQAQNLRGARGKCACGFGNPVAKRLKTVLDVGSLITQRVLDLLGMTRLITPQVKLAFTIGDTATAGPLAVHMGFDQAGAAVQPCLAQCLFGSADNLGRRTPFVTVEQNAQGRRYTPKSAIHAA